MKLLNVFFIIGTVLFSFQTVAQTSPRLLVGFKSGLSMSRFTEDNVRNSFLYSYHAGVTFEQTLSDHIAISLDLLYSRQGNVVHVNSMTVANYDRVRTRYNYLIMPVSLRFRVRNTPLLIEPGFQVGYLLKNSVDFLPMQSGYINNDLSYLKRSDKGFCLGVGYRINKRFLAEIKYYRSISTVFKNVLITDPVTNYVQVRNAPDRYNQVISTSLVYYPFKF